VTIFFPLASGLAAQEKVAVRATVPVACGRIAQLRQHWEQHRVEPRLPM
jgi:hypothetical protein